MSCLCCINCLTHSKHSSRVCCSYKLTSVKQTRRGCVHGHRQEGQSMRFWRTSWRKGYRASIANDLQHHSYGGAGVQRSQYHRFACVSDQPLPALLRYACRNQGWGWAVRLFLSSWLTCLHTPHPSLQKRACSLSPGRSCRDDRGIPGTGWGGEVGPDCHPLDARHLQRPPREPLGGGGEPQSSPMSCCCPFPSQCTRP